MHYAILAYVAWGLFPIFWKLLADLPALEVLCIRIVFTSIFYAGYLAYYGVSPLACFRLPKKTWGLMAVSSALLAANWFLFIYAVNSGHVIETSLGYFINPLVNVALGVLILQERLTPWRWLALLLAITGVVILTLQTGSVPWLALSLAITFGFYGFVRKVVPIESAVGSQMEALLMFVPVLLIAWLSPVEFHPPVLRDWFWLVFSGAITGFPLIWFAEASQIVPLNLMGFTQYISPSLQFLLGVVVYSEPFGAHQLAGFAFIWISLMIFVLELWKTSTVKISAT